MPEHSTQRDQSVSLARNLADVSASSPSPPSPSTSPTTPAPFRSLTAFRSNRKAGGTPEPATMDQHSPTASVSGGRGANATLRRRSSTATANNSNSNSTTATPTRSFTAANGSSSAFSSPSRHRAASLLTRVSPSLAHSPARFSSAAANVGLRAGLTSPTPSPAPTSPRGGERELGLGIDYSRGHGALPSPPTTASDATSTGSGLTGATSGSQSGSVGSASGRAELPPPALTPTLHRFQVPTIEKSSPTVVGNSPRSDPTSPSGSKRYSLQSSTSSTGTAVAPVRRSNISLRHSTSIEPLNLTSSNHRPSNSVTLPTSPDVNSSESDAATLTHLSDDLESPTPGKGKERERSNSGEGEDSELRRARRAKKTADARERNQRILDNINSTIAPLVSPPPSSNGSSPRRRPDTMRRQSNATMMRSLVLNEDRERPSSASGVFNSPRLPARESTDEFGLSSPADRSVRRRRSSTLGKDKDETERARRVRTLGHRGLGDGPERSYSSLSSYPVTEVGGGTRAWLDREYDKRASTSAGGEREREIEKSLRKLSSNERILLLAHGGESDENRERESGAGARSRPSLPLEFVLPPRSVRSGSPRLPPPRVPSPSELRERRTDSPTSFTPRRDSVSRASSGRPGSVSRPKKGSTGSGSTGSGILPYHADELESERASLARQRSLARLRTQSLAEPLQKSDTLRSERDDVFQNGLHTLDDDRRRQSQQQTSPSVRSGGRHAADRHDRSRSAIEVGSEAWLDQYQDPPLQQRGHHSRASGSSGDTLSGREVPQTPIERDRTIRAISALLSEQNITPGDLASIGQPQTAPAKLGSTRFDSESLRRRKSSATEGRVSSPSPYNATLARSKSAMSSAFPRTISALPGSDHPKLLQQAFEYFDAHFSPTDGRDALAPDSIDLVKRMGAMVHSTTKLNAGLRALVAASTEAQIEAELDEDSRTLAPTAPFEKSLNALLRASDDQVRSLTEGLIAFTRVERERDKLRRDGNEVNTRPASRAAFRSPGAALQMSPKRPATSSPFEGATVSMSAGRSSAASARLRDPLDEPDLPTRRATQSFSVRSPRSPFLNGFDSPTPSSSGRRDATAIRSPLSGYDRPSTPSRAFGAPPVPSSSGTEQPPQSGIRRSKSSANSGTSTTARPPTPGSRLPRSPSMIPVGALLDSTVAQAGLSPTRNQSSFPRANGFRAHSETSPRPALDALGFDAERDAERDTWRHTLSSSRSTTFPRSETDDSSETSAPSSTERGPRQRLSTGSVNLGQALRSLVRGRRNTNEAIPPEALVPPPLPDTPIYAPSTSIGSPDDRKAARRQEVEAILRRSGRAGRQSMG